MSGMFSINARLMRELIEYTDANPIHYTYPFALELAELAGIMGQAENLGPEFTVFVNHIAQQTSRVSVDVRNAEYLAEKIAEYDESDQDTVFKSMFGCLHPDFKKQIEAWKTLATNFGNHTDIYDQMQHIRTSEPAAYNRAVTISKKIAELSRLMKIVDAENKHLVKGSTNVDSGTTTGMSIAGKIMDSTLSSNIRNAFLSTQNVINDLQKEANFGFGGELPGGEFKKFIEKAIGEVKSALEGGAAKLVNGALEITDLQGVSDKFPAGIVEQMQTLFPDFKDTLGKIEGVVNEPTSVVSQSQRIIDSLKKEAGN